MNSGVLTSLIALTGGSPNLDFAITLLHLRRYRLALYHLHRSPPSYFSPRYPGVRQGAVVAESNGHPPGERTDSAVLAQGSLPVLVPGTIRTVAGDGNWIYQGDGVPATQAPIFLPSGLAVDAAGDLFLCDTSNNRLRLVAASTGLHLHRSRQR